jgi:hypothetical protein
MNYNMLCLFSACSLTYFLCTFLGNAIPLMAIDGVAGASDVLDGSLGDEEGETWCQNSEEGYIGDDT